jgi:hypothetical protein
LYRYAEEHDEHGDDKGPSAAEEAAEEAARLRKATSAKAKGTPNWVQCLAGAPAVGLCTS